MVTSLLYRRPAQVVSTRASLSGEEKQRSIESSINSGCSCMSNGIPESLSFDKIIAGGTCPPLTVRDFMNYLKYVEYSAENLQFFLWYKDYTSRFDKLPDNEKALSPTWTKSDAEAALASRPRKPNAIVAQLLQNTTFADVKTTAVERVDPFHTPPESPSLDENHDDDRTTIATTTDSTQGAAEAFDKAGMKWMPFTMQPYRDEITRIITVYISDGAPRQLNLSDRERRGLLHALQTTTHPSSFQEIVTTVEYSLRKQAHPNFMRWTICNGNRPRVLFARGLGIFGIAAGFIADLLLTLSHAGRAWRVLPFIAWFIGIATLIAAWKGMCVVLHGLHHRHLRPWELFEDSPEPGLDEKHMSQESLASSSRNSYEDEPWVSRYEKRNYVRKIFDREVWIEEPALRQIQDTIFLQALAGSFVLSSIVTGIFCAVPKGNFY
ncbi:hypothetical protein AMS68_006596 [Peltaster fructicola]|uniref:RGS domain-containing protein n=1 Tax=Peltaster fructicola TaxID=286661 RepID=A0A6H0Y2J9_9PEZI|nr:hypothetical protein AMS68_006596 [Peltaster fructicola]